MNYFFVIVKFLYINLFFWFVLILDKEILLMFVFFFRKVNYKSSIFIVFVYCMGSVDWKCVWFELLVYMIFVGYIEFILCIIIDLDWKVFIIGVIVNDWLFVYLSEFWMLLRKNICFDIFKEFVIFFNINSEYDIF